MAIPANLDAFLPREDFYADGKKPKINEFQEMGIADLRTLAPVLRKPDFQRTTDDWDPERIKQFIKSFAEGDVIPGVIFWASPTTGNIFVIDGAHRISAILAWVANDYGDGEKSRKFAGYQESADQIEAAEEARRLVNDDVGAFEDISHALTNPKATQREKKLATSMTSMRFKIQWVQGNAEKAEESFYRINLRAVPLDRTEIKLIRERNKPNTIATRAIVQNASGHPFWKQFPDPHKNAVIKKAQQIHSLLFDPPLKEPIKTAHVPIGGKAYAGTAMELSLALVELANKTPIKGRISNRTVDALNKTLNLLLRINGHDAGCLGLHPAVYFYSHATGKHQPAALMAVAEWLVTFDADRRKEFASVRKHFEDFLILNARALGQTISARGSKGRSVKTLIAYYDFVLDSMLKGSTPKKIIRLMRKHDRLDVLAQNVPDFTEYGKDFHTDTKSAVFLADALKSAPVCRICGARYQPDSVNADHRKDKKHGGTGTPGNLDPTHFYCNGAKDVLKPLVKAAHQKIESNLAKTPSTFKPFKVKRP